MREIKFRAWDKLEEQYANTEKLAISADCGDAAKITDIYEIDDWTVEYDLEQFTGLHDKNGKEIYEGDIVSCSEGCPHKIIWVEGLGGTFIGGMPGWYLSGLNEGYAWTEEEEVIGNIHENKELLDE
ncbi:YopX family protein [Fructobacillus sp. M158]|uniref:YopX family protein n=1 Tax=Fructobacillus parabroussonetiae TaxID=2713174 RepID=UPI00200A019E|nr:YopX family protein [Fructobacillus parabroussonetiae]MCK8617974.1 YopX family protein [Fructobacillus parabroussonetiae]